MSAPPPQQIAFDLPHQESSGRDDFVRGEANARALDAVLAWPDWPGRMLALIGPAGAGKSHLARIWAERSGAELLPMSEVELDRVLARRPATFVVEDIDRMAMDEVALFHLINHLHEADGAMMVTARAKPAAWPLRLADLVSRLRAAPVVEIGAPDETLIGAVLVKLLADRQIEIPPEAVKFAVARMERSLAAVGRLAARIDRLSLEEKRRVTVRLVGRALAAIDPDGSTEARTRM